MIYWHSFSDFLAMGGYGLYVWGSFAVTALILVIEPWLATRRLRQTRRRLSRQLQAETRRNESLTLGNP